MLQEKLEALRLKVNVVKSETVWRMSGKRKEESIYKEEVDLDQKS